MTIALVIKVNDGFVLASDSATSLGAAIAADGTVVAQNVYNNANKIFNLRKGLPIAAMTWGLGSIGPASISTMTKDLRARFTDPTDEWTIDPSSYAMADVAERFKEFFWNQRYEPMVQGLQPPPDDKAAEKMRLGLLVAGYSSGSQLPELFQLDMSPKGCGSLTPLLPGSETGASWSGQPEAIARLMNGMSLAMPEALKNLGVPDSEVMQYTAALQSQINVSLVSPPMPIQDAIDLAEFLVQVTIGFVRFSPGSPTVGGPIEIAAITKHEGFNWVKRKHFFDRGLNPVGM